MTVLQTITALFGMVCVSLAAAGLLLRGKARLCRAFTVYLVAAVVSSALVLLVPNVFFTWEAWAVSQLVFDALKLATAGELAYWIFLGLPGAAREARAVLFLFLLGTLVAVLFLPNGSANDSDALLSGVRPRLDVGVSWAFIAMAGLIRWHHVPLWPMHRAILVGMVVYLGVFGVAVDLFSKLGLAWDRPLASLGPVAYTIVSVWWAWSAWRTDPVPVVAPDVLSALQPWRAR
jgi:hypothetical protein